MKKKVTAKFLRESMPEWKKKKDPILVRFVTRPISFYISAFLANLGINANAVSYFSGYIAIVGACCFLFDSHKMNILGSSLVFLWLILDCVDGNLARSVKRQAFGDFADATSSYILIGVLITCLGFAAYNEGGVFFSKGNPWIILIGAFASSSDTMMRLIYHKYKENERELADIGVLKVENDVFKDHSKVGSWKVRLNMEMGIASFLMALIIITTFLNALDIAVLYCFFYYGSSFIGTYVVYVRKAKKIAALYEL